MCHEDSSVQIESLNKITTTVCLKSDATWLEFAIAELFTQSSYCAHKTENVLFIEIATLMTWDLWENTMNT